HADDVFAVVFLAHEEAALDVLGFAAGLDDVAIGIFLDEFDGRVEGVEILVRNDVDAGFLQLFLAERAIVLEAVGVFGAADDGFALGAEGLSLAPWPRVSSNTITSAQGTSFSQSVDLGTKPSAMSR